MSKIIVYIFHNFSNDRFIFVIYILLYKPFFIVFSSTGRWSLQYAWFFYLYHFLDFHMSPRWYWILNQNISLFFFENSLNYYPSWGNIPPPDINSLQYTLSKNHKLGWATSLFPMHSPNLFWDYYHHHASSHYDFHYPACICKYQQQIQHTWNWLPPYWTILLYYFWPSGKVKHGNFDIIIILQSGLFKTKITLSRTFHHLDIPHHQYVWPELLFNAVSMKPPRTIAPLFYLCTYINTPLSNLQDSFIDT